MRPFLSALIAVAALASLSRQRTPAMITRRSLLFSAPALLCAPAIVRAGV